MAYREDIFLFNLPHKKMRIIKKEVLAQTADTRITKIAVQSPDIAKKALAGQFVALMVAENGERIPLTIVDADKVSGTITLIFQELGFTTRLLGRLNAGDSIYALVGPLGHATEAKNYGKVILVAGGVGIAEVYPVAKAFKEAGNSVISVLGARTKPLLILEDELRKLSDETYVTTDDGSYGKKGFVTDILRELLTLNSQLSTLNLVYAVGPIPMMEKACSVTKEFNVKTIVSLNAIMVDATGMCGGCRVRVAEKVNFSCVDGPEFNGHLVDWEELKKRNDIYKDKEAHICRLNSL